jgi:hypothetical protein
MPDKTEEMFKVVFKLEKDENGYPPADWEGLWAKKIEENLYELDNVPFFARGISTGDIVVAEKEEGGEGRLLFRRVHRPSGHSTLRVVFFDKTMLLPLRDRLSAIGCSTELSHLPNLISVDIPPGVPLDQITDILKPGEEEKWSYEEASLRQSPGVSP